MNNLIFYTSKGYLYLFEFQNRFERTLFIALKKLAVPKFQFKIDVEPDAYNHIADKYQRVLIADYRPPNIIRKGKAYNNVGTCASGGHTLINGITHIEVHGQIFASFTRDEFKRAKKSWSFCQRIKNNPQHIN